MTNLPTTALTSRANKQIWRPHSETHHIGGTDPIPGVLHAGSYSTVTQLTSITTAVTCDTRRGQITTVSQTLGAGLEASFTVNNRTILAGENVVVNVTSTASAGGPFLAFCSGTADRSFTITISNLSTATAGNNTLVINFTILSAEL